MSKRIDFSRAPEFAVPITAERLRLHRQMKRLVRWRIEERERQERLRKGPKPWNGKPKRERAHKAQPGPQLRALPEVKTKPLAAE